MDFFYSIQNEHRNEIEIEKSRFITYLFPVETEMESLNNIEQIKKKHYDATHNVTAFYIRNNSFLKKYSDDGEPSGTAGIPSLQAIVNKNVIDICLVTTRYFGGIKLGAGGLVRAYMESALNALNSANIIKYEKMTNYSLMINYDLFGNIKYYIEQNNLIIDYIDYNEKVNLGIYINSKQKAHINNIINITSGNIEICENYAKYVACKKNKIISKKDII